MTLSTCKHRVIIYRNNLFLKVSRCMQNLIIQSPQFSVLFVPETTRGTFPGNTHLVTREKPYVFRYSIPPPRDATGVPYRLRMHLVHVGTWG